MDKSAVVKWAIPLSAACAFNGLCPLADFIVLHRIGLSADYREVRLLSRRLQSRWPAMQSIPSDTRALIDEESARWTPKAGDEISLSMDLRGLVALQDKDGKLNEMAIFPLSDLRRKEAGCWLFELAIYTHAIDYRRVPKLGEDVLETPQMEIERVLQLLQGEPAPA
ncbi:hypothetical protein C8F01DRAFT_1243502 [Mycena amicta]|nr:hypothetical protein C8F01DRAFT_1243502 [Mycena amicta]